jgi:hypothetical protein
MSALTETVFFIKKSANQLGISCELVSVQRYHRQDGYREFKYDAKKCDELIEHIKQNWSKNVTIYVDVDGSLTIWKAGKFKLVKSKGCQFEEK